MKVTSVFVALAAAGVASAARFNMAPLNLRKADVEVRTQEIHPVIVERTVEALNGTLYERSIVNGTIYERDVVPRNSTVTKRAIAYGSSNSTLLKN